MMRLLFSVLSCVALIPALAQAQTSAFFINDGVVNAPPQVAPQVDATNFVNNGTFNINPTFDTEPFDTSNTQNFTNRNVMSGSVGFRFDTFSGGAGGNGTRQMAASFFNAGLVNETNCSIFGGERIVISATNIINKGFLNAGVDGLLSLKGKNVDLTRGNLKVNGFDGTGSSEGIFDLAWGVGTDSNLNLSIPYFELPDPFSPFHILTNRSGFPVFQTVDLNGATAHMFLSQTTPTNLAVTVVFLANPNPAITTDVRFTGFAGQRVPIIEWLSVTTNYFTGARLTNSLYLTDTFGSSSLLLLVANSFGIPFTYRPFNYTFSRTRPAGFTNAPAANTAFDPNIFSGDNLVVTNDFSGYSVTIGATTQLTNFVVGGSVTNFPGRIEITAEDRLNLTRTRIDGLNYLALNCTNHFVSSSNAQVTVPFSDINLATTNGSLTISNLLNPFVPRINGDIDMWSGRWTNTANGVTIRYHVLMVDSLFASQAPAAIKNLTLRSTNVVISDTMNVFGNLLMTAEGLTLTTNGAINVLNTEIVWATALPRLQSLTNEGRIVTSNAVYFGGARREPHFNGNYDEPYLNFVNHGSITTEGSLIWANYFENGGSISAGLGPVTLQALSAVLTNGSFRAPNADITIYSSDLVVSNHLLLAGRKLSFAVTNLLSDQGATNNFWQVGDGFDLLVKPATGDLLATTVTNLAFAGAAPVSSWAGEDRGPSPAGYSNNAALGRLVLDGGTDSAFRFVAGGASNALYVDYLELNNHATNFNTALEIDPNMKVYFANANLPAEKLASHPSGRLCWVSDYAGLYSSTNIVYPSGLTNTFNTALVQSCNLDSDGDGIVNCSDPTPISTPDSAMLSIVLTSGPPPVSLVSWDGLANSTNFLYTKTNMTQPTWQLLTNFIYGPYNGRITVVDPANPNGPCFYRLRVDARRP